MNFLSKLKVNKNSLRRVKYHLSDDLSYVKYRSKQIKNRISDSTDPDIKNETTNGENDRISSKNILDKLHNTNQSTTNNLKITFVVTEAGENASAGDYFTALEFGEALKNFNCEISFLSQNNPKYWYEVPADVDILISLLYRFDPRRIRCSNKSLIKIAWPRNWFDRWVSHPGFSDYNLIFTPSKTAMEYVKENSDKNPYLFPLATNPERFNGNVPKQNEYISDYCFTGSYWNDPRDIMEMLEPTEIPFKFKLYGKNWEKNNKFKKYYQGFINYSNLPKVYSSTKIVIDDANRATKDYGSVNSRVYDAIACGALVLTNGQKGSKETFNNKLPVFKSKKELTYLINYYLSNNHKRMDKVKELQKIVFENHTYKDRAKSLKHILEQYIQIHAF
jgi:hypothetical protein